jgi:hypothetical protein
MSTQVQNERTNKRTGSEQQFAAESERRVSHNPPKGGCVPHGSVPKPQIEETIEICKRIEGRVDCQVLRVLADEWLFLGRFFQKRDRFEFELRRVASLCRSMDPVREGSDLHRLATRVFGG